MAWVCILRGTRHHYIGATDCLDRRIAEHGVAAITRRSGSGTTSNLSRQGNCHQFGNLADDFRAVCTAIGISPPTLPQYNHSNREHYARYYDGELRELVRARFAAEIERFEYTFEEQ